MNLHLCALTRANHSLGKRRGGLQQECYSCEYLKPSRLHTAAGSTAMKRAMKRRTNDCKEELMLLLMMMRRRLTRSMRLMKLIRLMMFIIVVYSWNRYLKPRFSCKMLPWLTGMPSTLFLTWPVAGLRLELLAVRCFIWQRQKRAH